MPRFATLINLRRDNMSQTFITTTIQGVPGRTLTG